MWRFALGLCAISVLTACGCQVTAPLRAEPFSVRAQDEGPLRLWLRPLPPDVLVPPAEMSSLPVEKQNLPFHDTSLRLSEAVASALQHSDVVRILNGDVSVSPSTQYDPIARAAERDAALAIFDPKLSLGYIGSQINEPPSSFFGPGISQQTRRDEGDFTASLSRLWQTGATSSISYEPPLGYLFFPGTSSSTLFNPIYSSAMVLQAKQPLLRGAGKEVNRAPIRIAQLRLEQSTWEFKQAMLAQVRSIEEAYWDLQAAYILLQAIDTVIPLAEEAVRLEQARVLTESAIKADVARAQVQLANFRQQRLRYESSAREKENQLRNLIGYPAADALRLVPIDPPLQQPPAIDTDRALQVALDYRPDLVQRRLGLRIREIELLVAQNGSKPQLDVQALYRANGVGQELDDALNQAGLLQYTDWTLGVTFSVPIGNRAARARARAAETELVRERALLRENVRNLGFRLADIVREIRYTWDQYEQTQVRVAACQEWMQTARLRFTMPPPNMQTQDALLLLLFDYQTALRAYVDAVTEASLLIATYNTLLAKLEEAQGTLLASRGIELADDPVQAVLAHPVPLYIEPVTGASPSAPPIPDPGWTQPGINPTTDYRSQAGWTQP